MKRVDGGERGDEGCSVVGRIERGCKYHLAGLSSFGYFRSTKTREQEICQQNT